MSNLLVVSRLTPNKAKKTPLLFEYAADLETAPYLVTSTRDLRWVEKAGEEGGRVRTAVRKMGVDDAFREVRKAVKARGQADGWGNCFGLADVLGAVAYVASYDLTPLELLAHPKDIAERRKDLEKSGLPLSPSSWMPRGSAAVVPVDRQYVGVLARVDAQNLAVLAHNPARGIALVQWGG